jgi:hypothetical protein
VTTHGDGGAPRFTNRLIGETSPYLLQHAHNPVDWYPWGDEAFAEAERRGVPVFLSVGYSTCHWCHVMEAESFEDLEIARVLNERYVAIKVDREERPDVDAVYMTAVQAMSGHGGWPMSVWLDPGRRPFYAGTYFPARDGDRGAGAGFLTILNSLADVYRAEPAKIADAATSIVEMVRSAMAGGDGADALPGGDVLTAAARFHDGVFDSENGGVRGAPKFPSSLPVRALLRRHHRTGDAGSLRMAERTLERMAAGGMHDQLAGGFHRYSTDSRWLVPHFEKMLYDNALLARAYAEAWQVTKRRDFERVARTTLDYLLREMTAPEGAFYSAIDADSEGEEGAFFVWSDAEIRGLLGARAERFAGFYGVTPGGNFEGRNVLFVPRPDEDEWESLDAERETLRIARESREHPQRDDKILAAWNGLAISAFAFCGRAFAEPRYVAAAERAANFVTATMTRDGRLQRSWKDGRTSGPGFLEDDACVTAGLLDLYEATFDRAHLAAALALADRTEDLFADAGAGGWYRSARDNETLIAREKPVHDGAEPSGASVAAYNALRLYAITEDERWRRVAEGALRAYGRTLADHPGALGEMLIAVDAVAATPREIVVVWPQGEAPPEALLAPLRRTFLPGAVTLGAADGPDLEALAQLSPVVASRTTRDGRPAAYVCERGACRLPVTGATELEAELR